MSCYWFIAHYIFCVFASSRCIVPKYELVNFFERALHRTSEPVLKSYHWNICLHHCRLIGLLMISTFDCWPWEPFQQCPLTCWVVVESFIEIHPVSKEMLHHTKWILPDGQTDGQTTVKHNASAVYCWPRHKNSPILKMLAREVRSKLRICCVFDCRMVLCSITGDELLTKAKIIRLLVLIRLRETV